MWNNKPFLMDAEGDEETLDKRYLDARFVSHEKQFAFQFLQAAGGSSSSTAPPMKDHPLVKSMRDALNAEPFEKNIFKSEKVCICLSLSGGVDSIVH